MATVSIGQADAVSSAFPEAREQCGNWVGVLGQEASIAWHRNLRAWTPRASRRWDPVQASKPSSSSGPSDANILRSGAPFSPNSGTPLSG